jgi:hypothetical protein
MPTRKPSAAAAARSAGNLDEPVAAPLDFVRQHADALYRAAAECAHQHDRIARLFSGTPLESEERSATALCRACDETLGKLVAAYERAANDVHPHADEPWWHRANALWIASREYVRRHAGCDELTRRIAKHSPDELGSLHMEFELEASALLALRQACEGYAKVRPEAR